jgi:hypothetical protein
VRSGNWHIIASLSATRLCLRQTESAKVMEQFQKELLRLGAQASPKTPLGKAIGNALRQWKTLQTILFDGALRIDNKDVRSAALCAPCRRA